MRIGELSDRTGASPRSLRYYEQQGLISADRTAGDQRVFTEEHVRLVGLIQTFFAAGLSSATITELLPCMALRPSGESAHRSAEVMKRERKRLQQTVSELQNAVDALEGLIAASETYAAAEKSAD